MYLTAMYILTIFIRKKLLSLVHLTPRYVLILLSILIMNFLFKKNMKITVNNKIFSFPTIRLALEFLLQNLRNHSIEAPYSISLGKSSYTFLIVGEFINVYKNNRYLNRFPLTKL